MIDVTHHCDDGRARQFDVVGISRDQLFELFFGDHVFEGNKTHVIAEALAEIGCDVVIESLIYGRENAALKQQTDNFFRLDAELVGKFFDGRSFNETNRLQISRDRNSSRNTLFERAVIRRRHKISVEPPGFPIACALTAARRSAP